MIAYVLVSAKPMSEHEVYLHLVKSEDVDEVFPLFGEFDIIFRIKAESKGEASVKIQKLLDFKGILATKTLFGY